MLFQTIELACHSSIDHTIFLANGRVFLTLGVLYVICYLGFPYEKEERKNFALPDIWSVGERCLLWESGEQHHIVRS